MSKYQVPQNCEFLRVRLINSKLWNSESLQDSYRDNDKLMYKNQKLITKPMLPIVQIMNSCLEKNDSVNNRLFDLASDGFSMMAYVHKDQSNIRLLKPAVSKPYHKLCNALAPVTENLFGDGLHKQIKDMNESRKVPTIYPTINHLAKDGQHHPVILDLRNLGQITVREMR